MSSGTFAPVAINFFGRFNIFPTTSTSPLQPYRAIDSPGFGNNSNKALGQNGEHWPADFFNVG
jgi:hypothetical protein